ncbi:MAG: MFS transporter [Elusimicrobia bacterium]|nr:MFS transporter [Elusimicrobiota bacterium]
MFRSLSHRNFRLFFFGQTISLCGSWMQQTAQSWLIYRLTKDPMMLGLSAFAGQFPVFLFGFYAGSVVDQADHVKLLRWTQFLAMVQASVLAVLVWLGRIQVWHVFTLAFCQGLVNAFDMPARQVLIGELVPSEHRHNAIALNSTITNAMRILGPALAGLIIGSMGEGPCFALNAASFITVIAALHFITDIAQKRAAAPKSVMEEIRSGLAYAAGHRSIKILLLLLILFSLAGLPIYVLLPVFAEDVLRSGAKGLGILSSASGLGATCGALILARRPNAKGLGEVITKSLVLFGVALGGLALSNKMWLSCFFLWLIGWAAIKILAGVNTLLQDLSSDFFRGRIMSFYAMIFIGLSPLGSFLVGGLASSAGVTRVVLAQGLLCVLLGAWNLQRLPELLRRPPGPHAPEPPPLPIS